MHLSINFSNSCIWYRTFCFSSYMNSSKHDKLFTLFKLASSSKVSFSSHLNGILPESLILFEVVLTNPLTFSPIPIVISWNLNALSLVKAMKSFSFSFSASSIFLIRDALADSVLLSLPIWPSEALISLMTITY